MNICEHCGENSKLGHKLGCIAAEPTKGDTHTQQGMFEDVSDDLLKHIDDIPEEQRSKWPQVLAELVDLLVHCRQHQGADLELAKKEGLGLALEIAHQFGGIQFYLPSAASIAKAVRDTQIWQDHTGDNIRELSSKYRLTGVHIYAIIAQQRKLHIKSLQPDMFGE